MTIDDEKYYVSVGMKAQGGSFVKALGEALAHADDNNVKKIKEAWPAFWDNYLALGKALEPAGDW